MGPKDKDKPAPAPPAAAPPTPPAAQQPPLSPEMLQLLVQLYQSGRFSQINPGALAAAQAAEGERLVRESEKAKKASERANSTWFDSLETAASSTGIYGAIYVLLSKIGRSLLTDATIVPNIDPLGEATARMPEEIRRVFLDMARSLPPRPDEDQFKCGAGSGAACGDEVLWYRLTQEAKQRGYWPIGSNRNPNGTTNGAVLKKQIEAYVRLAQELPNPSA